MSKSSSQEGAIYDARSLGAGKVIVLGLQHMFAMFGSTVLVPALTGLSVSATLLFAGLGTLLFHLISKRKVPAFLGSSFAFLAGYFAIAPHGERELLPYACFGVACAGLVYLVLALLIKAFGINRVMKFFPPIVTGPIIIAIGLCLSGTAVNSCSTNWLIALVAILIIVICNIWGKGMVKIIPILLGVFGTCLLCIILTLGIGKETSDGLFYAINGNSSLQLFSVESVEKIKNAAWIGLPVQYQDTVFSIFTGGKIDTTLLITSVITIVPIALATIVEHIGDISAISSTVGKNFIADPGLHRTLTGDGLATTLASLFGAPANTTYGENTGVLTLSKVYDPMVIRLAAVFAVVFSLSPKLAACISAIPTPVIGGISLVLYGMISAVGVRNIVENQIDFSKSRNVIIAAIILVLSIGVTYSAATAINIPCGSMTIKLTGLAVGSLAGIILNAVLPGKDYVFEDKQQAAQAKDETLKPEPAEPEGVKKIHKK
ncbi:MAG: uracil-xanthine permease family protein [Mageeibacillus sp.]|nr:uracil-xanthine permease family protein [Mageeibacillus sp.]MCI1264687.1 uracil-xanthine permease family protein [Saccharofermentans sp.]MCI2044754.1 uracil-xanthine permease family protein [Mageeibacillus sp.]